MFYTALDPADAGVQSSAQELAGRLVGDAPVEVAVRDMLDLVASGSRIVIMHAEAEVSPAGAAELLGVTRQFVDRLCENGVLDFWRLPDSRHRRIKVQDVIQLAS